jgi:hypothetical protein
MTSTPPTVPAVPDLVFTDPERLALNGLRVSEALGADKLGLFIQLGVLDDPWPSQVEVPAPT